MLIQNAIAYVNEGFQQDVSVRLERGAVLEVGAELSPRPGEETVDARGQYLLPGFVDVHIHAFRGHDTMEGEEAVRHMSRELYRVGVAAFLPTTMSASAEDTRRAVAGVEAVMNRPESRGSLVLGAHMEAPFLAESKCGAQVKAFFRDPSMAALEEMTGGRTDRVRMITMAPERDGSEAFIRAAAGRGLVVSIGHTSATAEQTHQAADWGATHVTHTFNAQTPLHHREPGVPGAALTDDRLFAEMICDGIHLHPDVIRLMVRAKGASRAVMITDAMEAAGMPDGQYTLGANQVFVKDGEARLAQGNLAGSTLTMDRAVRNMAGPAGAGLARALRMATRNPADSLGLSSMGRVAVGAAADLVLLDPDLQVERTLVQGRTVYRR